MKNKKKLKKRYNVTLDQDQVKRLKPNLKRFNKRYNMKVSKSSLLNDAIIDFNFQCDNLI